MEPLIVIKIGGNIIDDEASLSAFLKKFASIKSQKILVHGGGKLATRLAAQLDIPQQMIDGRRITDHETLKLVTMVYAGYINKNIVAQLQSFGCPSIGLSGADGNAIQAHKRVHAQTDYGFVGDIDAINYSLLNNLLSQDMTIVMAPITHDKKGQLLNTNADTIAQEIAKALAGYYDVSLIYSFEKPGVLLDANDNDTVIKSLNLSYYRELKEKNLVFAGMLPKLDNAFAALENGVKKVIIGQAMDIDQLVSGASGTTISNE